MSRRCQLLYRSVFESHFMRSVAFGGLLVHPESAISMANAGAGRVVRDLDLETLLPTTQDEASRRRVKQRVAKAPTSALEHDFPKLAPEVGGWPVIWDNPPPIYH